ncbi:MAG: CpXC domain-containing protein [Lachnospiraceae bacterium]|nr:CpXC domain-containing protein [Lachnospiraceae bacterium]
MDNVKKQKMQCFQCGKDLELEIFPKMEIPYDLPLRDRALQNTLFKLTCPECNGIFNVAYESQYNDMERKYLLWVVPKLDDGARQRLDAYNQRLQTDSTLRLAQGGYRYRIVCNGNELREKIIIFDEGLDDRYVEMLKLVYAPAIKKNVQEDAQITGIFFDKSTKGTYHFVACFQNLKPICIEINMDIYRDMQEKSKDVVNSNTAEGVCRIDAQWAYQVMRVKE